MISRRTALASLTAFSLIPAVSATAAGEPAVPLRISDDGAVISVHLNGRAVDAVLDTGASHTVLDLSLARELGIDAERSLEIAGGRDRVAGGMAAPVELRIGERSLHPRPLVMDLQPSGLGVPLIIGADVFRTGVVRLDFAYETFRFLDDAPAEAPILLQQTGAAMLALPLRIDGVPWTLGLDTGSQTALTLPPMPIDATARTSTWVTADISGWHVYPVRTAALSVAGVDLTGVPANISAPRGPEAQGLIGLPVLRRFDVTLDMAGQRIWLTPLPGASRPFVRDRLGLAMLPGENELEVVHVAAGSPAEAAGLRVGDPVVRINGLPVGPTTNGVGRGAFGEVVQIETASGLSRRIALADYY